MIEHASLIRLCAFLGCLTAFGVLERVLPRRKRVASSPRRWGANLGMVAFGAFVVRWIPGGAAVGVAVGCESAGWGFSGGLGLPRWAAILMCVVLLDLLIYGQHVVFHRLPWLWRLHRMHHTDLDIDASSALRFHPVEICLSMGIKMIAVAAIGAPPEAVILFEALLNGMATFNHANLRLPASLDTAVRCLVVTPDMHRVHHSIITRETDSNFGFNLSCWDRLFRTYRPQPREGHEGMTIGLSEFLDERPLNFGWLLVLPFLRKRPDTSDATD